MMMETVQFGENIGKKSNCGSCIEHCFHLRFRIVRRYLGSKDTEFGSGAGPPASQLLPPQSLRLRWPSQAASLFGGDRSLERIGW